MLRFPGDAPIEAGNRSAEDHRDWLADFLEAFEGSQFALAQVWGGAEGCVKAGTAYLDAFKAAATGTPSMDITVSGGVAIVGGKATWVREATNLSLAAPAGNPRIDTIQVSAATRTITAKTGVEAVAPLAPEPDAEAVVLWHVYHRVGEANIQNADDASNGYLSDAREWLTSAILVSEMGDLSDVDLAGLADGDILVYRTASGKFKAEAAPSGGGVSSLGDLSDVDLAGLADGDILVYRTASGKFEPGAASGGGGVSNLADLLDVNVSMKTDGDVLFYNASSAKFEAGPPAVGADSLADLSDVSLTGVTNGDTLIYSWASGKFIPGVTPLPDFTGTMVLTAQGLTPAAAGGCAVPEVTETPLCAHPFWGAAFDGVTNEAGWFCNVALPADFKGSTSLYVRPVWTAATGTAGQTVTWNIIARAFGDGDTLDALFTSNAATVTDALIAAGSVHVGAATALTINGTPAANKLLTFRVSRSASTDSHAGDASLIALLVSYTATRGGT
jgi:hypothetical protein